MRIDTCSIDLPFRTAFVHASARRKQTAAVAVRICDDDRVAGYGEGCPRDYVTGEDVPGALEWLDRHAADWARQAGTLAGLQALIALESDEIDRHPAAFCALELALLDRLARRHKRSVEALLGLQTLKAPQPVTAVLGASNPFLFWLQSRRFRQAGMSDVKLKLTGDAGRDLRRVRGLAWARLIRVDGNNLWLNASEAATGLHPLLPHIWAVEEPLAARDYIGLIELQRATGLTVILDESLTCDHDLDAFLALKPPATGFIVNLRLSKLGGLLRTLALAERLQSAGFGLILGSQVGETSLLARAGLAAAANLNLRSYEGAYGLHLLARDAFTPTVTFTGDGHIDPAGLDLCAPGWGLKPTAELMAWLDGGSRPRSSPSPQGPGGTSRVPYGRKRPGHGSA